MKPRIVRDKMLACLISAEGVVKDIMLCVMCYYSTHSPSGLFSDRLHQVAYYAYF